MENRMTEPNALRSYTELGEMLAHLPITVKEIRRMRGLSLRDVCAESGVSLNSLSRFERGISDLQCSSVIKLVGWIAEQGCSSEHNGDLSEQ